MAIWRFGDLAVYVSSEQNFYLYQNEDICLGVRNRTLSIQHDEGKHHQFIRTFATEQTSN